MANEIRHVEINLGKACNNRCLFCMIERDHKVTFPQFEDVRKEIDKYAKSGFNSLGFLGGEPTIFPPILECVRYAREKGFKNIHVVSNGRRYSDTRFLKSMIDSGVTRFSVSIHSHVPEIEDELTQVKGGFRQKISGLQNLILYQRQGLIRNSIPINIVINKMNYETLPRSVVFFNKLGISEIRLNFMRIEGRARLNFSRLAVKYSECYPAIRRIIALTKTLDIGVTLEGFPRCALRGIRSPGKYIGEMKDYLNLVVCLNDHDGIRRSNDTFLWKRRRCDELKVKGKECKKCICNSACEGIWRGYAETIGLEEFKPIIRS